MLRLQVLVNGCPVCTAARQEGGSLHAHVDLHPPVAALIWEDGARRIGHPLGAKVTGDCELEVMAQPPSGNEYEYLGWAKLTLKPGDEVTIRVLEPGESDPPVIRRRPDADF
jgi:hypothetical protein